MIIIWFLILQKKKSKTFEIALRCLITQPPDNGKSKSFAIKRKKMVDFMEMTRRKRLENENKNSCQVYC